ARGLAPRTAAQHAGWPTRTGAGEGSGAAERPRAPGPRAPRRRPFSRSRAPPPSPAPAAAPGGDAPPAPRPEAPAAVIGAGGFLGSALVPVLQSAGVPVTAFTRKTPFLTDSGAPDDGLLPARTVFWLASSINPAIGEAEPGRVHEDRETFVALLRALERLADPPRVVLVSSGGTVYDPAEPPPYREGSPTRPHGAYGRAKLELERRL